MIFILFSHSEKTSITKWVTKNLIQQDRSESWRFLSKSYLLAKLDLTGFGNKAWPEVTEAMHSLGGSHAAELLTAFATEDECGEYGVPSQTPLRRNVEGCSLHYPSGANFTFLNTEKLWIQNHSRLQGFQTRGVDPGLFLYSRPGSKISEAVLSGTCPRSHLEQVSVQ